MSSGTLAMEVSGMYSFHSKVLDKNKSIGLEILLLAINENILKKRKRLL